MIKCYGSSLKVVESPAVWPCRLHFTWMTPSLNALLHLLLRRMQYHADQDFDSQLAHPELPAPSFQKSLRSVSHIKLRSSPGVKKLELLRLSTCHLPPATSVHRRLSDSSKQRAQSIVPRNLMLYILQQSNLLWGRVAPLAAGVAAAGMAQGSLSEALPCTFSSLRVPLASSAEEIAELEAAGPGMLLGRGDPRTRKGKVRAAASLRRQGAPSRAASNVAAAWHHL